MEASSSPVPTPKRMVGTPGAVGQLGEEPGRGRQHQLPVVVGVRIPAQLSKIWTARGPGVELGPEGGEGQVGESLRPVRARRRLAVHQGLHLGEVLGRAPLHQVAGHGEGRPAKPISGTLRAARPGCPPPRPRRAVVLRFEGPEALEVFWARGTAGHHRPVPGRHRHRIRWPPPAPRCRRRRWPRPSRSGRPAGRVSSAASRAGRWHRGCCPSPAARYSGRDRPAWRMNHTGTWSTGAPARPTKARRRTASDVGRSTAAGHRGVDVGSAGAPQGPAPRAGGPSLEMRPWRESRRASRACHPGGPSQCDSRGHTIEGSPEPEGRADRRWGGAELQGEQAFVDMAYARLDAMRDDANSMLEGCSTWAGGHVPVAHRARRDRPHQPGPARAAGHRRPGADLRPHRPAPDGPTEAAATGHGNGSTDGGDRPGRDLPYRPAGHPQRRSRSAGGRLARPDRRAFYRATGGIPRVSCSPPPRPRGPHGGGPRGRALRRPGSAGASPRSTGPPDGSARRRGRRGS